MDLSGFGAYRRSCIHINADDPETHKFYIDGDLRCLGEYVLLTGTELAGLEIHTLGEW